MSLYIYAQDVKLRERLFEQLKKHRWTDSGFDIPLLYSHALAKVDTYNYTINLYVRVAAVDSQGTTRPCLLLPRSSIGKTPVRISNSIGLIDQGYRGEVQAKVDIVNLNGSEISAGDRLFQICRHDFLPWENVIIVTSESELPKAPDSRGDGGFGSTGV